ncbi:MAG: FAD-dependent thymidylate synthase [Desulfosarcina sp.]|nr:FAD-dependent thymidylate synthase [Desulfobacterales bacterium]
MKIIPQSHEILQIPYDPCKQIEVAARTCYKSEAKITDTSAPAMATNLIESGHHAMIEHAVMTVRFITDRGVSHELLRHRIASYAQESSRYCNYSNKKFGNEITVINPVFWEEKTLQYNFWKISMESTEKNYFDLLRVGATPQEARSVLPTSLKTEIVMTCNMREWRHALNLRCSNKAHPQFSALMLPLLKELHEKVPVLFDDIYLKYFGTD